MNDADLRAAIAALKAHHRLALVQAIVERAWEADRPLREFYLALAETVADVHNQIGAPKRAVLAEARRIIDAAEWEELRRPRFFDADGNVASRSRSDR